jgi:hypothetical protein
MDAGRVKVLSRDEILGAKDTKMELVEVPEWNGSVYVKNLDGTARDEFEGSRVQLVDGKVQMVHANTRARLLSMSVCDETGKLLFTRLDIMDLGQKSGQALDRLYEVAARLSALRPADLEEKLKNLGAVQSGNSASV